MRIILYETPGTKIVSFRTNPKGREKKVIKAHMWKGDPKKLRKQAEKHPHV